MNGLSRWARNTRSLVCLALLAVWVGLVCAIPARGQDSDEHKKHHPKDKDTGGPGMAGGDKGAGMAGGEKGAGMMGGGMEGMMDGMMKKMGVPPPRELYPSLMSLPELTAEEREKVGSQAQERMHKGVKLMSEGMDRLATEAENKNYAKMQEATAEVREGLAQFESGLAAHRALTEGKPPRQVALQWFKSEMSLQPPQGVEANSGSFGLSALHYFTMALLVAFALAMLAMYYFTMRRAAALFGRLDPAGEDFESGSSRPKRAAARRILK